MNLNDLRLLFIVWASLFIASMASAATRVALVSTCGGEAGQNVLALAGAKLSALPDITLLERREINRIVGEQQQGQCGRLGREQAIAAGRLLGVEVFAIIEQSTGKQEALGLVVFDAGTGVRLGDETLAPGTNAEITDAIAKAVQRAITKRSTIKQVVRTVSLASLRNADLPRELDSLCQAVGLLVERQLVRAPNVALLERQRLDEVNRERDLPTTETWQQLRASLVLIDLEISRGPNNTGLAARARLTDSSGKNEVVIDCRVAHESAADLARALLAPLQEALHAERLAGTLALHQQSDTRREAQRFFMEAEFLVGHRDWRAGLQAAESAAALDPANKQIRDRLVEFLVRAAGDVLANEQGDVGQSLDLAARAVTVAMQLYRSPAQIATDEPPAKPLSEQELPCLCLEIGSDAYQLVGPDEGLWFWYFEHRLFPRLKETAAKQVTAKSAQHPHPDPLPQTAWERGSEIAPTTSGTAEQSLDAITQARLVAVQECVHDLVIGRLHQETRRGIKTADDFAEYTERLAYLVPNLEIYAPSAAIWLTDLEDCVNHWLGLVEQYPLRLSHGMHGVRFLARLAYWVSGDQMLTRYHPTGWRLGPAEIARLKQLIDSLQIHPDPLVQMYGKIGHAAMALRNEPRRAADLYRTIESRLVEAIEAPGRELVKDYRSHFYNAGLDAIDLLLPHTERRRAYLDWFELMLSRRELAYWVIVMATDAEACRFRHFFSTYQTTGGLKDVFPFQRVYWTTDETAELAANFDRVAQLIESADHQDIDTDFFCTNTGSLRFELARLRPALLRRRPDLRPAKPWASDRLLFDACGHGGVLSAVADNHYVYVLTPDSTKGRWVNQLVRVPMAGGNPVTLGKIVHEGTPNAIACLGDKNLFAGTADGIDVFPLAGGKCRQIGRANGLPATAVQALACLDGQLYVALGETGREGFIVRYDLATDRCTVLASSRRHEKRSPLDDIAPPFRVTQLIPDPDRGRVLAAVGFGLNVHCYPLTGLWAIDGTTGVIHQLGAMNDDPSWAGVQPDGQVLLTFRQSGGSTCENAGAGIVGFDPLTDKLRLLYSSKTGPAGPDLEVGENWLRTPASLTKPCLQVDGWLWFRETWSDRCARISIDGKQLEYLPPLDENAAAWAADWYLFQLAGDGRHVLVGEYGRLWLLTLAEQTAEKE